MLLDRTFDISVVPVSTVSPSLETLHNIKQFLFHEARLMADRKLDEWLALWTPEGRYWVPRKQGQENPFDHVSLFWEDAMLRSVRVKRVENARNWSQQPVTRSSHLIGNISITGLDAAGCLIVESSFQITEWRLEQRQLAGSMQHKLAATEDGSWKIAFKRVNLVNCEAVFSNLEVFL